jgi:alpha-L-fucosidase
VTLPRAARIAAIDLREDIAQGQRVAAFTLAGRVNGAWQSLVAGSTIGYRRAARIAPVTVDALRLDISDATEPPLEVKIGAFRA